MKTIPSLVGAVLITVALLIVPHYMLPQQDASFAPAAASSSSHSFTIDKRQLPVSGDHLQIIMKTPEALIGVDDTHGITGKQGDRFRSGFVIILWNSEGRPDELALVDMGDIKFDCVKHTSQILSDYGFNHKAQVMYRVPPQPVASPDKPGSFVSTAEKYVCGWAPSQTV